MATKISTSREVYNDTPPVSLWNDALLLGAGTAESYTIPAGVSWLIISPSGAVWVNSTTTAVVPVADISDGTGPFRIGADAAYHVKVAPGQVLSMIREGGSSVTVSIQCWDKP